MAQSHARARTLQHFFEHNCSSLTALEANWKTASCKGVTFHKALQVDLWDFETALINAAQHIGMKGLTLRGMAPTRDPTTLTGWK